MSVSFFAHQHLVSSHPKTLANVSHLKRKEKEKRCLPEQLYKFIIYYLWPINCLTWGRRVAVSWITCAHVFIYHGGICIFTILFILAQHCNSKPLINTGGWSEVLQPAGNLGGYYSKWNGQLSRGLSFRRVWGASILLKQHLAKSHNRGTKDRENEFRLLLQNADCCRIWLLVRDKYVMWERTVCSCCTFHCVTK